MKKLLLTIDLDVNDPVFGEMTDISKINYDEIVDKSHPQFNTPEELLDLRIGLISNELKKNDNNLLIGFAINEKEHLNSLISSISNTNYIISEIFLDDGSRRLQRAKEYEEEYKLHSRWLGYSPEEIEHMNNEFYKKVDDLVSEAKGLSIKCTKI